MSTKDEILNLYRHSKGAALAAEKLARSEGVLKCPVCQQLHAVGTPHPVRETNGVQVEHRVLKRT